MKLRGTKCAVFGLPCSSTRQTDWSAHRQTNRQTDRQTDRQTHTETDHWETTSLTSLAWAMAAFLGYIGLGSWFQFSPPLRLFYLRIYFLISSVWELMRQMLAAHPKHNGLRCILCIGGHCVLPRFFLSSNVCFSYGSEEGWGSLRSLEDERSSKYNTGQHQNRKPSNEGYKIQQYSFTI